MYPIVQTDNELLQRYINGDENALAFLLKKVSTKNLFVYHDAGQRPCISGRYFSGYIL
jgi:hypothetical protein